MKIIDISTQYERSRSIYRVVGLFSLAIVLFTTIYGITMSILQNVEVVGQTFVNVEFPPIHIFPVFYMKPISWLFIAIVGLVYCTLELGRERIIALSPFWKKLARIIAFCVGSMALYEVLFNFALWSGLMASGAILGNLNPDVMVNPFPNPQIPWSIVFATKMYLVLTITMFYGFDFVTKLENASKQEAS